MNGHSYTIIILIALIFFSLFRRIRKNIGRQQLNHGNLLFRIVLFFMIALVFLALGAFHPVSFISDIVGILLGGILAYYGIALTTFEQSDGRLYYRPNIWIGSIVSVIFIVRLLYRFYGVFIGEKLGGIQPGQPNGIQHIANIIGNSWTSGLMLIMFAYYVIYYSILLKKQEQLFQKKDVFHQNKSE